MAVDTRPSAAPATGSKHIDARTLERLARRIITGEGPRETMEIIRPATGQPLGTVPRCTPEDLAAAVVRARAAQARWKTTPFAERKRILLRFHDLVLARREELLDLLQLE